MYFSNTFNLLFIVTLFNQFNCLHIMSVLKRSSKNINIDQTKYPIQVKPTIKSSDLAILKIDQKILIKAADDVDVKFNSKQTSIINSNIPKLTTRVIKKNKDELLHFFII